ncbi:ATPase family AAA domain-containing protein 5-like isoform X2 [Haliotis rufescens]|uniref:ATPase family AAA domain-containing protein 5-like isoform X2 n=1 Tax=Haliotis rufescens TaxID=6454 RepID=UPI00201E7D7E|nr:ATPase family AAA domain-containing protein 5-like isoform X2 [Haliotis rufescens]
MNGGYWRQCYEQQTLYAADPSKHNDDDITTAAVICQISRTLNTKMLEDKIECDKATKAGVGSPQSSILDFFVSPNKSNASKKQKERSEPTGLQVAADEVESSKKQETTSFFKGQSHDNNDNLTAVADESSESVILLSDDSNSKCNGHVTETELLNQSGVSNRRKSKHREGKVEKKSKTKASDCAEVDKSDKDNNKKSSKKLNLQRQKSVETKTEDVTASTPMADETKKLMDDSESKVTDEGEASKKRKRNDSDDAERKRNRTSEPTDVPADKCPSTEMSYEAFIQSLSPKGCKDEAAAEEGDISCQDEKGDTSCQDGEKDTSHQEEKRATSCQDEEVATSRQDEEVQILEASPEDQPTEVTDTNKSRDSKKKRKSAKASLFKEGSETNVQPVKDDSSGDDGEKKKTPSILNFFTKVNPDKNTEHQVVTVMADVHHQPIKENGNSKKSHEEQSVASPIVLSPKSPGVIKLDEDIEMLSSETVEEISTTKTKKDKASKKGKSVDKASLKTEVKVEEPIEEVTIEKVEIAPRSAEVDAFLKSSDSPAVPAKSAQATLSFTKTGLKATSATIPSTKTRIRTQPEGKSTAKIPTEEGDISKVKQVKKKRGRKKKDDKGNSTKDDSMVSSDGLDSPKEVRTRRPKYQVSSLQFDDSRRTPIKMKIRLKKASSGEESEFTPRSSKTVNKKGQKQAKAQQLLEKAKKVKKTRKSKVKPQAKRKQESVTSGNDSIVDLDSSTDGGGRRRSARLAVQVVPEPITVEDEEDEPEEKPVPVKVKKSSKTPLKSKPRDVSKTLKAKDSPRKLKAKDSPRKLAKDSPSKPKSKGKLASIFMGKSKSEVKLQEPEDPEKVRLRQAFLMSDVPEKLKRQVVAVAAVQSIMENTGLPEISHVQQIPDLREENSVWNLAPVKLPLRSSEPFHRSCVINWADLGSHRVVSPAKSELFKDFRCHMDLPEGVMDELLGEVETGVRGLPVKQIYADMRRKLEEDLRSQDPSLDSTGTSSQQPTESATQETGEEKKKKKGRGRTKGGKLSLPKKSESVPAPEVIRVGEMMWTERYQPSHSMEVLGHTAHLQKLKSWLLEWKHRTHKEARKMRLQMLKQAQPKAVAKAEEDNAWWGEEDSDFDMDTDDSEDEDDSLCNTMLITGPHGVGKTASVYALAQELGYKVIEVNAASSRNGKKILSKLQEATQSHQVATSKDGSSNSMMAALTNSQSGSTPSSAKPAKKDAKLPTAFTNLFRKAGSKTDPVEVIDLEADTAKKQESPTKSKRKRKREKDVDKVEKTPKKAKKELKAMPTPGRDESSQTGGLELSTTTLILFDEAEISFEDDKGYLPAIQHFMMRTKIPIILTTTDPSFSSQLQARYEGLTFKQPSQLTIAGHLQTICLVEQVRTGLDEMLTLVKLHGGDIRKCLLWLQYWLSSGGGASKLHHAVNTTPRTVLLSVDENTCSQDSDSQGTSVGTSAVPDKDDDDFVVSKPSVGRRKRVLDDDDSSGSNVFPSRLSSQSDSGCSSHLPLVHCLRLESLAGISQPLPDVFEKVLQSYLRDRCDDQLTAKLQEMCKNLHSIGMSSLSGNLFHLLPLPKVLPQAPSLSLGCTEAASKENKLSRIRTDLFDDEGSCDAPEEEKVVETLEAVKNDSVPKEQKVLSSKCLNAFSQYYDSMCDMDIMGACTEVFTSQECYAASGVGSDSRNNRTMSDCPTMALLTREHNTEMNLRSARHLYGTITTAVDSYRDSQAGDKLPDEVTLPVPGGRTTFSLLTSEPRLSGSIRRTHENVSDSLPLNTYCSHRSVHMDYLPSLRAISRAEQHRQIAKTKRRFHHYFDNIGMSLKETSLNVLCQTFS